MGNNNVTKTAPRTFDEIKRLLAEDMQRWYSFGEAWDDLTRVQQIDLLEVAEEMRAKNRARDAK